MIFLAQCCHFNAVLEFYHLYGRLESFFIVSSWEYEEICRIFLNSCNSMLTPELYVKSFPSMWHFAR